MSIKEADRILPVATGESEVRREKRSVVQPSRAKRPASGNTP